MMQLISFLILALSFKALAHVDTFLITKSFNTKNVLHYEAIINECRLVKPFVDVYWIVGEKQGEEAKLNVFQGSLAPKVISANDYEARFTLKALKKIDVPGSDNTFVTRIDNCKAKTYVVINGEEIELREIYADAELGFGVTVNYIIIKGIKPDHTEFKFKINAE